MDDERVFPKLNRYPDALGTYYFEQGLTKRDFFVAAIIQGFIAKDGKPKKTTIVDAVETVDILMAELKRGRR